MPTRSAPPVLSDGVIVLRQCTTADAEDITVGCQDPETQQWTLVPVPYQLSDSYEWLDLRSTPAAWWASPAWAITVLPDDRWSGEIEFRLDGEGAAEVGYQLAPWARGHGYMTRALRLACSWAFANLDVTVITWMAPVGNIPSRQAARRAGFRIPEVILRRAIPQRGRRIDAWVGDLLPEDLREEARRRSGRDFAATLTTRELMVLQRLAHGESNHSVAVTLGISENTVKNHVRSILEKLQARSRSEAVVAGLRLGLISLPDRT